MTILLLDTRLDRHYLGETVIEVVAATGRVKINFVLRCVEIDGQQDGVSFGHDYSHDQFIHEAYSRALQLLRRRGFAVFTEHK